MLMYLPGQTIKALVLPIERFDLAFDFGQQGLALAVQRLAGRNSDPAFADAIFVHIIALFIIEPDTDVMFKDGSIVVRAARIDREPIRKWGAVWSIGHGGNYQR